MLPSTVRIVADQVLNNSFRGTHVRIIPNKLVLLASVISKHENSKWEEPKRGYSRKDAIFAELIANSINYCYWYGKGDIRPNGANAALMYTLLYSSGYVTNWSADIFDHFYGSLSTHRFPMLEERYGHLMDIHRKYNECQDFVDFVITTSSIHPVLQALVKLLPGYGADIFLKRAQLFIMQLCRKELIRFEDSDELTVPADYQVPRVLRHFGCLEYGDQLENAINNHELIPRGSIQEVEIRAASIKAVDTLAHYTHMDTMHIDNFLWQSRGICSNPLHLTITTDY